MCIRDSQTDNYFSPSQSQDPESSTVAVPRLVQPCDSSCPSVDEHGFPIHPDDWEAWATYHQASSERQERQVVVWHEWLCQPAAVDAARYGGVVLDPELLTKAQQYARCGIPAAYRCTVYGLLSHPVSPGVYASYCAQAERCQNEVLHQIDRDINRTFTVHPSFKLTSQGVSSLRSVLRAVAMRFPYVGYCQGMNFVTALLLVVTKYGASHDFSSQESISLEEIARVEESAFWVVCGLIDSLLPEAFFGSDRHEKLPQLHGLRNCLEVVTYMMEEHNPELVEHLKDLGLPPSVFAVRWLPCLFSGCLPAETCLRIWDLLLAFGECVLYRAVVALMEMHKEQLLGTTDPQWAFDTIQAACTSMYDADAMLKHFDLTIDQRTIERVQEKIKQQQQQQEEAEVPEPEEGSEGETALQVMSGLFEDLGASWIIVEAVFKHLSLIHISEPTRPY
eukprot:TRINITY_DN712_c0_g4_i1.p1 TRINITY_DN712_c0_g4~~TRINITY_DN712_c0_g4_i1.p1  ORF type:complete len:449 (+),score=126.70 TRINITY_DN712_c0_g4_i1:124-1470(+)